jgi:hypothetical protein
MAASAARSPAHGALAALVTLTASAAAAQTPSLEPGTRVRVTSDSLGRVVGVVAPAGRDTIAVTTPDGGSRVAIPVASVERLDVSRGRTAGAGAARGALIGAAVSGGLGVAATGLVYFYERRHDATRSCYESCYLGTAIVGVLSGVVLLGSTATGALIGAAVGAEGWRRVPLADRVGVGPTPDGAGLAVRLAF